jgi:hypothetical protein
MTPQKGEGTVLLPIAQVVEVEGMGAASGSAKVQREISRQQRCSIRAELQQGAVGQPESRQFGLFGDPARG